MPTTYAIPNGRTVVTSTAYTGTNATQSIVNTDLGTTGFKPDLVWLKQRSGTAWHGWFDSVRGATKGISSNDTGAEVTSSAGSDFASFNSNGFTVGPVSNWNSTNIGSIIGWQWQAGQGTTSSNTNGSVTSTTSVNSTAGFSIVSYAGGQGSDYTIGHGLPAAPSVIFTKSRGSVDSWGAYYTMRGVNTNYMTLNTTDAQGNNNGPLAAGAYMVSNATTLQIASGAFANDSASMIAYCWTPIPGFSAFGTYVGNGSSDGPFVYCGFRPNIIIVKSATTAESWYISSDAMQPYNGTNNPFLNPNSSVAETTAFGFIQKFSNGFKCIFPGADTNASGQTYIYMAFATNPFKYANAR